MSSPPKMRKIEKGVKFPQDLASEDLLNNPNGTKVKQRYKLLTSQDLLPEMHQITKKCSEFMGYPETICRILLHHYKWFDEALLEKFYEEDSSNLDAFFKKFNLKNQPELLTEIDDYFGEDCGICDQRIRVTSLECAHKFCYNCWNSYLEEQVKSQALPYVTCPQYKCNIVLSDEVARELMEKDATVKAYDNLIIRSFVESNRLMRWCPGKECGRIVKLLEGVPVFDNGIECECKMIFCFTCALEWHEPMKCELDKKWLKQVDDDKGTYLWLNAYTKDCSKCNAAIEKNGGCNHMTCRKCNYEFCWICLKDWKLHINGNYNCNRYNENDSKDLKHQGRAAVERYLHYYNRFINHQNSLKLEDKLKGEVQRQMKFLQDQGFSFIETCFMLEAVKVLNQCRRTLMYTYGFAYYLEKSNQVEMFETNQSDLELATETLSGLLEKDLSDLKEENGNLKGKLANFKCEVLDKTNYVGARRLLLLNHCTEGYESDYWNFVDRN
uniref:RBR-type E3 ubiquitin transferase n=1 Tax=Acrobeloides nanus TaxID=290746 RepID=A0A914DAU9_9BILA